MQNNPSVSAGTIGRATLWSVGNAAAGQLLSLLVFFVTARLLSPGDFGVAALAIMSVEMVKRILIEPFATSLLSIKNPSQDDYDACFTMILIASIAGVVGIVALSPIISMFIGNGKFQSVLQIIAGLLLTNGLSRTHEVWYSKHYKYKLLAIRSIISVSLGGLCGIAMSALGFGVWSLVGQQIIAGLSALLLLWLGSSWRPKAHVRVKDALLRLPFVGQLALTNILNFPANESDLFVATSFLGPSVGGLYSAAKRITLAASVIATYSIQNLTIVSFSNSKSNFGHSKLFIQSLAIVSAIIVPLFFGLSIMSGDVITVLVGKKWSGSARILQFLAIAALFQALLQFTSAYLIANGRSAARTAIIAVTAVSMVITLPLVSRYGVVSLACGTSIIFFVSLSMMMVAAVHRDGPRWFDPLVVISAPIAASAVMAFASSLIMTQYAAAVRLIVVPPILIAIYVGMMLVFRRRLMMGLSKLAIETFSL